MAVYTRVSDSDLRELLTRYAVGELLDFTGIETGVVNTNYFVTTTYGEYVLTLFEKLSATELPYFLELMRFLSQHGVASPEPLLDNTGSSLQQFKEKPTAFVTRLRGASVVEPTPAQCAAVGTAMAEIHRAADRFPLVRQNPHAYDWWVWAAARVNDHLSSEDQTLLREEIAFQSQSSCIGLPEGVIHADLFRDNVLFDNNAVSGIIDFYYACTDAFVFDLAITVNDWCQASKGTTDADRARALLRGYQQKRAVTEREIEQWPVLLRAAALRWWLARLLALHFPRAGEHSYAKDPAEFKRILEAHKVQGNLLRDLWD